MPFIVVTGTDSIALLSVQGHPTGDRKNVVGYVFIGVRGSHRLSRT